MFQSILKMIHHQFVQINYLLTIFLLVISGCTYSPKGPKVTVADLRQAVRSVTDRTAYAGFDGQKKQFYIGNGLIERRFQLSASDRLLHTVSIVDKLSGEYYLEQPSQEFCFQVSGYRFSGLDSQFLYQRYKIEPGYDGSRILRFWMNYQNPIIGSPADGLLAEFTNPFPDTSSHTNLRFSIQICYRIYPHQARIDKWLVFKNQGNIPLNIEEVYTESLPLFYNSRSALVNRSLFSKIYGQYLEISPTIGSINRLVSIVNHTPGPFKTTDLYKKYDYVSVGLTSFDVQMSEIITAWPSQSVVIPTISLYFGRFTENIGTHLPSPYLETEDLASYQVFNFENETIATFQDQLSSSLVSQPKAIRLPVATVGKNILNQPNWLQSRPAESDQPIYCLLSDYGFFLRDAVDDLLVHSPVNLVILSGPLLEKDNNGLQGCANITHNHGGPVESTFLTYNWLFDFSVYIRQRHPNVKLCITAKAYGLDQPDYACLQYFDFFVK